MDPWTIYTSLLRTTACCTVLLPWEAVYSKAQTLESLIISLMATITIGINTLKPQQFTELVFKAQGLLTLDKLQCILLGSLKKLRWWPLDLKERGKQKEDVTRTIFLKIQIRILPNMFKMQTSPLLWQIRCPCKSCHRLVLHTDTISRVIQASEFK